MWGPHNSLQDAYTLASSLIRETEALKPAMEAALSQDISVDNLRRLWRKCRANANDLLNIRTLVPGIGRYAASQHPARYDVMAKWAAAEAAYKAIADEIETLIPETFTAAQVATVKSKVSGFPDIRS